MPLPFEHELGGGTFGGMRAIINYKLLLLQ